MDRIGYYHASCNICGESYNGYGSHSCPPKVEEASKAALENALAWAETFSRTPDRGSDAKLYDALQVYKRALAAEPGRKRCQERMDALAKEFTQSGAKSTERPKSVKRK